MQERLKQVSCHPSLFFTVALLPPFVLLAGCTSAEPPKPCDGLSCFTFQAQVEPQCQTQSNPNALGIFVVAKRNVTTAKGSLYLTFRVRTKSADGTQISPDGPERQPPITLAPGERRYTGVCATGNENGNFVQRSLVMGCGTSRFNSGQYSCAQRPQNELFPNGWEYTGIKLKTASIPESDCLRLCKAPASPAACLILDVPSTFADRIRPQSTDWGEVLAKLHNEFANEKSFPLTAARWKELTGIDPTDFGRGGSVYLKDGKLGQIGDKVSLPFIFDLKSAKERVNLDIYGILEGTRTTVPDAGAIRWSPEEPRPKVRFRDNDGLNAIYGAPIEHLYLLKQQVVVQVNGRCVAAAYQRSNRTETATE